MTFFLTFFMDGLFLHLTIMWNIKLNHQNIKLTLKVLLVNGVKATFSLTQGHVLDVKFTSFYTTNNSQKDQIWACRVRCWIKINILASVNSKQKLNGIVLLIKLQNDA